MKKTLHLKKILLISLLTAFFVTSLGLTQTNLVSASTLPSIIITEICANSDYSSSDGSEAFEFIEFKNTGTSSFNMQNYTFKVYDYQGNLTKNFNFVVSYSIPAGAIRVMWIKGTQSSGYTVQNFVDHYNAQYPGLGLTTSMVVTKTISDSWGLSNAGYTKVQLEHQTTGSVISYALYNDDTLDGTNTKDCARETSITYTYPSTYLINGITKMTKVASNQAPMSPGLIPSSPSIQVTELMVNPTSDGGGTSDAYEYIELYNTGTSAVSLSGYKLLYYTTDSTYTTWDLTSVSPNSNVSIPAKGYAVIWVKNSDCGSGRTITNFNDHYNTNLTDSVLYQLDVTSTTGLDNTDKRSVVLATDAGVQICKATYNDGSNTDGSYQNMSILYEAPVNGTINMINVANNQRPTPSEIYNQFFGQIHSHTNVSDGQGTPSEAFTNARDSGYGDYYIITDHSNKFDYYTSPTTQETFDYSTPNYWTIGSEWKNLKGTADTYNQDNVFTAIGAYEMTWGSARGWWGHINTLNTDWYRSGFDPNMTLPAYYDLLKNYPDSISQLNHPGDTWGTFYDFAYRDSDIDAIVPIIEWQTLVGQTLPDNLYYNRALDKGWHVGPARNSDTHDARWLTGDGYRTVILASRLTREGILDALRNRRFYSIDDTNMNDMSKNGDLRVMFKVNGNVMGSRLTNPGTLNITVDAWDPDPNDTISKISIIADGGTVVASQTFTTNVAHFSVSLDPSYKYYYAKVQQADETEYFPEGITQAPTNGKAYTAPVWIEDNVPFNVALDQKHNTSATLPTQISAKVTNSGSTALSNVAVKFFRDSFNGMQIGTTQTITSIAAGATVTVTQDWPDIAAETGYGGVYEVYANATASVGGVNKTVTNSMSVSDLLITEVVANSPGAENYEYLEVYNNQDHNIDLAGYKFLHWTGNLESQRTAIDITNSTIIPPGGKVVFWCKHANNSTLTRANFNAQFGTNLTSEQLYEIQWGGFHNTYTNLIFLQKDDSESLRNISHVWYNYGLDRGYPTPGTGLDATVDGSCIRYKYSLDGTNTMTKDAANAAATPGTVLSTQVPEP